MQQIETEGKCADTRDHLAVVLKATNFAAIKHKDQLRKDGRTPYINHPIGVAYILSSEGNVNDAVVLQAAILHDTVEDTETTFDEIEELFGKVVRDIVAEVTDDKSLPKEVRKQLQIEHASKLSFEAKLVKLADKLYNLRDLLKSMPQGWTETRVNEYFVWAAEVTKQLKGTNANIEEKLKIIFNDKGILF